MHRDYYSNGKLLLTGEYAVLDGALSLALPTRFGQSLKVRSTQSNLLKWTSLDENDHVWFEQTLYADTLEALEDHIHDEEHWIISKRLISILKTAKNMNPNFLTADRGYEVKTSLDFNRSWGLGTSSTLVNNIAQWAGIDPFELYHHTFGGSGYDIACAIHNRPILYSIRDRQPQIKEVVFDPGFKEHLCFVHLKKKQDSREGIERYRQATIDKKLLVEKISNQTQAILESSDLTDFQGLLKEHEELLASALQMTTIQNKLFKDYQGVVKSLGAWGGDFVLAASSTEGPEYFSSRGYETVLPYEEIILT